MPNGLTLATPDISKLDSLGISDAVKTIAATKQSSNPNNWGAKGDPAGSKYMGYFPEGWDSDVFSPLANWNLNTKNAYQSWFTQVDPLATDYLGESTTNATVVTFNSEKVTDPNFKDIASYSDFSLSNMQTAWENGLMSIAPHLQRYKEYMNKSQDANWQTYNTGFNKVAVEEFEEILNALNNGTVSLQKNENNQSVFVSDYNGKQYTLNDLPLLNIFPLEDWKEELNNVKPIFTELPSGATKESIENEFGVANIGTGLYLDKIWVEDDNLLNFQNNFSQSIVFDTEAEKPEGQFYNNMTSILPNRRGQIAMLEVLSKIVDTEDLTNLKEILTSNNLITDEVVKVNGEDVSLMNLIQNQFFEKEYGSWKSKKTEYSVAQVEKEKSSSSSGSGKPTKTMKINYYNNPFDVRIQTIKKIQGYHGIMGSTITETPTNVQLPGNNSSFYYNGSLVDLSGIGLKPTTGGAISIIPFLEGKPLNETEYKKAKEDGENITYKPTWSVKMTGIDPSDEQELKNILGTNKPEILFIIEKGDISSLDTYENDVELLYDSANTLNNDDSIITFKKGGIIKPISLKAKIK